VNGWMFIGVFIDLCLDTTPFKSRLKILICRFAMSSTALKKTKRIAKTKTKQSLAEPDVTPTSPSKGHKPKLTKAEEHAHETRSKRVKGEGTKRAERPPVTTAEETRPKVVADTGNHANRTTRKLRGPLKAPSPSPSLSPMSDLEPSHSEEDEPEVPQEEGSPGEEDVHLYGFSTDEDSSDDDLDVDEEAALDVGSLPTVARDDATVKRKLEKAKRKPVRVSFLITTGCKHDALWPFRRHQKRVLFT